MSIRYIIL